MAIYLLDPPTLHSSSFTIRSNRCPFLTITSSSKNQVQVQKPSKKELSRILRTEAAIKAIERKANSSKYNNLWPKAVLEALDDAIRTNYWESALKIFALLRMQHWYEPRSRQYAKLLVMLGKCRQPKQASLLFETMLSDGLPPTIEAYTALVSAYGYSGLFDEAFSTINHMKSLPGCKPDIFTYSILIKCCSKLGHLNLIGQVLEEMAGSGTECSTVTYNTIVDAYGKAGHFELMESLLVEMIENGKCHPDIFTLNSVIGAYGRLGQVKEMEKWFEEFQIMGIKPDVMTYNILIKSYGELGMYQKMSSVLEFMRKRFYSPTVVTYNVIIEIFGKAGNIEKMNENFRRMKHLGVKPNSITYCSLVRAYSRAGLITKVDSIMRQVDNSDVRLDTPFFNCAISAYGKAGELEKMSELLMQMKESGCEPDNITWATMIQAYRSYGMIEDAQNLESKLVYAMELERSI